MNPRMRDLTRGAGLVPLMAETRSQRVEPNDPPGGRRAPGQGGGLEARDVYALAGLPIDAVGMDEVLARIEHSVRTRERLFISTPNSNFTVAAQSDDAFRRSVQLSDLVVPDGMPLVAFARLLRLPVQGRVTGADMFEQLLARASLPIRVYFYGGPPGSAEAAEQRIQQMGGRVIGVGHASPGFVSVEELSDQATIDHINACKPDFVVVALGSKKGQAWILRNQHRLTAPVISYLGAVVNFTAGRVKRAPAWMQRIGAEWVWRIYQEPVLWRRYWDDGRVLLSFFFRNVLPEIPGAWFGPGRAGNGRLEVLREGGVGGMYIALSGNWRGQRPDELLKLLDQAIANAAPVTIDATALRKMDARVTGALLLAEARLPSLQIVGADSRVRRSLDAQRASFLLAC